MRLTDGVVTTLQTTSIASGSTTVVMGMSVDEWGIVGVMVGIACTVITCAIAGYCQLYRLRAARGNA